MFCGTTFIKMIINHTILICPKIFTSSFMKGLSKFYQHSKLNLRGKQTHKKYWTDKVAGFCLWCSIFVTLYMSENSQSIFQTTSFYCSNTRFNQRNSFITTAWEAKVNNYWIHFLINYNIIDCTIELLQETY